MSADPTVFDKIKIGDSLLISFVSEGNEGDRYACKLIGYKNEQSLICLPPVRDGKALFVREGQAITVRMVSGNNALAFNSHVLKSNSQPYPYMHIASPNQIAATAIRSAIRTKVLLAGTAMLVSDGNSQNASATHSVTIENLSENGVGFVSNDLIGSSGDEITIKTDVVISSIPKTLELPGIIRNVQSETETDKEGDDNKTASADTEQLSTYRYGIQLTVENKTEQLFLNAFINQHIVEVLYA